LDLLRIRNSRDARFDGNSRVSKGLDKRLFNNDFAGTWGLFRRPVVPDPQQHDEPIAHEIQPVHKAITGKVTLKKA
jgi:hypothetical protein